MDLLQEFKMKENVSFLCIKQNRNFRVNFVHLFEFQKELLILRHGNC